MALGLTATDLLTINSANCHSSPIRSNEYRCDYSIVENGDVKYLDGNSRERIREVSRGLNRERESLGEAHK
jgi:hypothetical protein